MLLVSGDFSFLPHPAVYNTQREQEHDLRYICSRCYVIALPCWHFDSQLSRPMTCMWSFSPPHISNVSSSVFSVYSWEMFELCYLLTVTICCHQRAGDFSYMAPVSSFIYTLIVWLPWQQKLGENESITQLDVLMPKQSCGDVESWFFFFCAVCFLHLLLIGWRCWDFHLLMNLG